MDSKGRWRDKLSSQRLWRSVKYKEVYPYSHETAIDVCADLTKLPTSSVSDVPIVRSGVKRRATFSYGIASAAEPFTAQSTNTS